jgi:hypothetical protein
VALSFSISLPVRIGAVLSEYGVRVAEPKPPGNSGNEEMRADPESVTG